MPPRLEYGSYPAGIYNGTIEGGRRLDVWPAALEVEGEEGGLRSVVQFRVISRERVPSVLPELYVAPFTINILFTRAWCPEAQLLSDHRAHEGEDCSKSEKNIEDGSKRWDQQSHEILKARI